MYSRTAASFTRDRLPESPMMRSRSSKRSRDRVIDVLLFIPQKILPRSCRCHPPMIKNQMPYSERFCIEPLCRACLLCGISSRLGRISISFKISLCILCNVKCRESRPIHFRKPARPNKLVRISSCSDPFSTRRERTPSVLIHFGKLLRQSGFLSSL